MKYFSHKVMRSLWPPKSQKMSLSLDNSTCPTFIPTVADIFSNGMPHGSRESVARQRSLPAGQPDTAYRGGAGARRSLPSSTLNRFYHSRPASRAALLRAVFRHLRRHLARRAPERGADAHRAPPHRGSRRVRLLRGADPRNLVARQMQHRGDGGEERLIDCAFGGTDEFACVQHRGRG